MNLFLKREPRVQRHRAEPSSKDGNIAMLCKENKVLMTQGDWKHPSAELGEISSGILQLSGRIAQHKLKQGHCLMFFFGILFQLERLKRECKSRKTSAKQGKDRFPVSEVKVTTTVTTKGKNAGPIKVKPGEKSRKNLQLLRDMQTIQTSLQKDDISWDY